MSFERSYFIANVSKNTKASCGHLFQHYERKKDELGNYIKFGNLNINLELSHANYNLAPDHKMSQNDFLKQRCSEVRCMNRKDINVMVSWVVTLPKELLGNQEKEILFFKETYKFLEKKYGQENVISAYVHMDEVMPHIHFSFVPVVRDEKKNDLKICAKECITKQEL